MLNLHIILKNITIFAFRNGALAKRLCTGLQNQVGRFDSATHLQKPQQNGFCWGFVPNRCSKLKIRKGKKSYTQHIVCPILNNSTYQKTHFYGKCNAPYNTLCSYFKRFGSFPTILMTSFAGVTPHPVKSKFFCNNFRKFNIPHISAIWILHLIAYLCVKRKLLHPNSHVCFYPN